MTLTGHVTHVQIIRVDHYFTACIACTLIVHFASKKNISLVAFDLQEGYNEFLVNESLLCHTEAFRWTICDVQLLYREKLSFGDVRMNQPRYQEVIANKLCKKWLAGACVRFFFAFQLHIFGRFSQNNFMTVVDRFTFALKSMAYRIVVVNTIQIP